VGALVEVSVSSTDAPMEKCPEQVVSISVNSSIPENKYGRHFLFFIQNLIIFCGMYLLLSYTLYR